MPNLRLHFNALLARVNPSDQRLRLAQKLPGEIRDWLRENMFETASPHTRLSGSYARSTAILDIKDVDILLFLPAAQVDRTPNAVLLEVKRLLDDYPDAYAETSGQRRSVHLEFPQHDSHLDIVPVVALHGVDKTLKVPDRPGAEWIDSDPLGYAARLSALNVQHGGKLVPLIKLVKAWRDVNMPIRRPKSFVLEVMVLNAVESGSLNLCERSTADNVADFFECIAAKYDDLMESGTGVPRILDPQVPSSVVTRGWQRGHFETFMRRSREASRAARRAINAIDERDASDEWERVFGELWPNADEVKRAARDEAATVSPGRTRITSAGGVLGSTGSLISTRPTTYHGK